MIDVLVAWLIAVASLVTWRRVAPLMTPEIRTRAAPLKVVIAGLIVNAVVYTVYLVLAIVNG